MARLRRGILSIEHVDHQLCGQAEALDKALVRLVVAYTVQLVDDVEQQLSLAVFQRLLSFNAIYFYCFS